MVEKFVVPFFSVLPDQRFSEEIKKLYLLRFATFPPATAFIDLLVANKLLSEPSNANRKKMTR